MSEQYLILHKVRGEPSFDCAIKIPCPSCESARQGLDHGDDYAGNCSYCDDGCWWITNSGYRAYPIWKAELSSLLEDAHTSMTDGYLAHKIETMPADWPDHFQVEGEKPPPTFNIMNAISGLLPKINRRV